MEKNISWTDSVIYRKEIHLQWDYLFKQLNNKNIITNSSAAVGKSRDSWQKTEDHGIKEKKMIKK